PGFSTGSYPKEARRHGQPAPSSRKPQAVPGTAPQPGQPQPATAPQAGPRIFSRMRPSPGDKDGFSGHGCVPSVTVAWFLGQDKFLLAEGGDEDRLDGVQAVLGLVEDDAGPGVEDLAGHFQAGGHAGVLHDLASDGGVRVVEG